MININRIHFEPLLDYANNRIYFVYFVSYRTVTESRQPMYVIFRLNQLITLNVLNNQNQNIIYWRTLNIRGSP